MIDLHSHVLPGLDDGARDVAEAVEIVRSMESDGVRVVAATPHVRDDYPTTPEQMEASLEALRAALDEAGVGVDVLPGGEIALDRLAGLDPESRARFGLGGNPRLMLIEFPYVGWPQELALACEWLRGEGVVPVIAHPERALVVQQRPGDLDALVRAGAIVQLTAASVDGRLGRATASCARRLLELELAHLVSSDAHAPGVRAAGLSAATQAVGAGRLGDWLTHAVPAALLAGGELPPRPSGLGRRGIFSRRRR